MTERLTNAQARRIALAAQGLGEPRPKGRVDRRHLRRVLDRMGLIQIDSVNVLVRSQELPLFARLGPHPRSLIADATATGELFEYWAHEASHVRTAHHHLYRWHMNGEHKWERYFRLRERRPGFVDEVYRRVATEGPIAAGDLAERVIPAHVLARPAPAEREARKELLVLAAQHHGVGTFDDLTDYHRQRNPPCRPLLDELVEDGRLLPVTVDGWSKPAYLHPAAKVPRRVNGSTLLSPFDPVVWHRERTERLFGFRYRIEIYVPQPKRQYGYYVLPFLMGDELVARVDLKADRPRGALLAQGAFAESGAPLGDVADALAGELHSMAGWLGLGSVEVGRRGDLVSPLRSAVRRYART